MKKSGLIANAVISAALVLGSTQAQADDSGDWKFSVAPLYLWGKSIKATTSAAGKSLPIELDFKDDVLENLDAAFAIHLEARKDKLTLFLEYNLAELDPSAEASRRAVELEADVTFKDIMWEGGVTWAFADSGTTRWEALGGLRYYKQDLKIDLKSSGGPGLLPERISAGDDWVHPFAGVRVVTRLSDRWTFRARADAGYEDSDNQALQGIAMFDYRFRNWGSAFLGYRYLDMDFDNTSKGRDQYGFDGDQQGPLLGLNMYF